MVEYIPKDGIVLCYSGLAEIGPYDFVRIAKYFADQILSIPAADVTPVRHGRWIMRGGRRFCSECNERACVTRDMEDFWYMKGTDYCPSCGAKMDL